MLKNAILDERHEPLIDTRAAVEEEPRAGADNVVGKARLNAGEPAVVLGLGAGAVAEDPPHLGPGGGVGIPLVGTRAPVVLVERGRLGRIPPGVDRRGERRPLFGDGPLEGGDSPPRDRVGDGSQDPHGQTQSSGVVCCPIGEAGTAWA